ncbi:MAG: hypothetical protein ACK57R_16900 [Dolichospermum sp.]
MTGNRGQGTEINYQLPITNYQLPVTNYQLITHYQLPSNLKTLDSRGQGYGA